MVGRNIMQSVHWLLYLYPQVNCYITMEHHHFSWVKKPINRPFSIAFCLFTRGVVHMMDGSPLVDELTPTRGSVNPETPDPQLECANHMGRSYFIHKTFCTFIYITYIYREKWSYYIYMYIYIHIKYTYPQTHLYDIFTHIFKCSIQCVQISTPRLRLAHSFDDPLSRVTLGLAWTAPGVRDGGAQFDS